MSETISDQMNEAFDAIDQGVPASKAFRTASGMTIGSLASVTGMEVARLAAIEAGSTPTQEELAAIAAALDLPIDMVTDEQEIMVPVSEYLPEDVILALDTFAMKNAIGNRQEAVNIILRDALISLGYLPHVVEEGTRPEDLTTENDR